MANVNSNYLLAIESAISGGSIALFESENFVSGASGGDSVSRAEDLLPRIIDLLNESGVTRGSISRIAISLGPGSYTGLRIGIATVMGLCRGLGIDYVGVPLFGAIAEIHDDHHPALIALPMGKSDICASEAGSEDARVTTLEGLKNEAALVYYSRILAHSDLVANFVKAHPGVVDIGTNLARFVGAAALHRSKSTSLDPIYIQNPRFA